jgi:SH3-like domain-containing protein
MLAGVLILIGLIASQAGTAFAQSANRGPSGLPLPRFVSLDADKVNMRVGPGIDYSISWRYLRSGVPMEIIQEYDNWRKVRDAEGADGWIHEALLSGERTAIVSPWMRGRDITVEMRSEKEGRGTLVAQLRPGVVIRVRSCDGNWCEAAVKGLEGFVAQKELWGAYPGEVFN